MRIPRSYPPHLAALLLSLALAPATAAQEPDAWPQYGYDGGTRFATPGTLRFPLKEQWRYAKAPEVVSVASGIIYLDRVYLSCVGDQNGKMKVGPTSNTPLFVVLNVADGKKAWEWSHQHDFTWGCWLAAAGKTIVFNDDGLGGFAADKPVRTWYGGADSWGQISVDERAGLIVRANTLRYDYAPGANIEAFDFSTKAKKWMALQETGTKMHNGIPFCSLSQGAGLVFVAARFAGRDIKHANGLYALKQDDGKEAWLLKGNWGGVSCDGNHVYAVQTEDRKLYCLNATDGKTVWSLAVGEEARHPPAISKGLCVVVTDGGNLLAVPLAGDGAGKAAAWKSQTGKPFTPELLTLHGLDFEAIGMTKGGNKDVLDEKWHTYRRAVLAIAKGAGKNGAVVVANDKHVEAFDLRTGASLWKTAWDKVALGPAGNPVIANGRLIVTGTKGVVCYAGAP